MCRKLHPEVKNRYFLDTLVKIKLIRFKFKKKNSDLNPSRVLTRHSSPIYVPRYSLGDAESCVCNFHHALSSQTEQNTTYQENKKKKAAHAKGRQQKLFRFLSVYYFRVTWEVSKRHRLATESVRRRFAPTADKRREMAQRGRSSRGTALIRAHIFKVTWRATAPRSCRKMHEAQVELRASLSGIVLTYFSSSTGDKAMEDTLRFLAPKVATIVYYSWETSRKHHKHNIRKTNF